MNRSQFNEISTHYAIDIMNTERKNSKENFSMKQPNVGEPELKAHNKFLEEHKASVNSVGKGHEIVNVDEIKRSKQNLALVLEKYFKVICIP